MGRQACCSINGKRRGPDMLLLANRKDRRKSQRGRTQGTEATPKMKRPRLQLTGTSPCFHTRARTAWLLLPYPFEAVTACLSGGQVDASRHVPNAQVSSGVPYDHHLVISAHCQRRDLLQAALKRTKPRNACWRVHACSTIAFRSGVAEPTFKTVT
jgi:hypothetical protein